MSPLTESSREEPRFVPYPTAGKDWGVWDNLNRWWADDIGQFLSRSGAQSACDKANHAANEGG